MLVNDVKMNYNISIINLTFNDIEKGMWIRMTYRNTNIDDQIKAQIINAIDETYNYAVKRLNLRR